ncbi:MAG TPA: hypothetical protein VNX68_00135, partial [Nitrosopumilaceae archaeon]|nr:hypothetical protein [Nitrosopumilaceae archaeon]
DELIKQPQLFWLACEGYADAADKRDTAKHISQKMAAELASIFRAGSLEKVTEAKVTEHVDAHPTYVEQVKAYLGYKKEAELWSGIRDTFAQRQSMIRDLVSIHTTGYFASGLTSDADKIEALKTAYNKKKETAANAQ